MPDRSLPLEFDARLVEEAVALSLRGLPSDPFWRVRSLLYEIEEIEEIEELERRFSSLNKAAFESLRLAAPIYQALSEEPLLALEVGACQVLYAVTAQDEGAELYVAPAEGERSK